MMSEPKYTDNFYQDLINSSHKSAAKIVPLVMDLVAPKSVVDVGCGVGVWLSIFRKHGVEDFLGIDGSWVNKKYLQIPADRFLAHDLRLPLTVNRRFDLVVSLEAAEHVPSECAEIFINSLVSFGPVVLFSAAIPSQGGIGHINEQWPDYWAKYFRIKGYVVVDYLRGAIWNEKVSPIYAQNILLFIDEKYLKGQPALAEAYKKTDVATLCRVHPEFYAYRINPENMSLRELLHAFPAVLREYIVRKLKR
ncbi:MAG: methyltransferase domain-containing protein [Candidatus Omnitrophota bacterium]